MPEIKNILCPVDFSDYSRHALAHAAQLATLFGSRLVVFHVYPPPVTSPTVLFGGLPGPIAPLPLPPPNSSAERSHEDVVAYASAFASAITRPDVPLIVEASPGLPATTILEHAQRVSADLIVMGTHGHSGFERLVLGSVTEKVLRKAACPVLTVPPAVADPGRDASRLFSRMLCAVDFSDASLKGLEYALVLAREARAALMIVHVVEGVPDVPEWRDTPGPVITEYLRLSEEHAQQRLRAIFPEEAREWCRLQTFVPHGKPYQEILSLAQQLDAHLIVMGVHGRGQLERWFFGSTTNQVVRAASCPVLTLRG